MCLNLGHHPCLLLQLWTRHGWIPTSRLRSHSACAGSCQWGKQLRQREGQAIPFSGRSTEEAYRGTTRRRATSDERDACLLWTGRDKTPALGRFATWTREKGSAGGAVSALPNAHSMEKRFISVSTAVAEICSAVYGTGEAPDRAIPSSQRKSNCRKRKPLQLQSGSRLRRERRSCHAKRFTRACQQGFANSSREAHCRELHQPQHQPSSTAFASRASCAAGRGRSTQKTPKNCFAIRTRCSRTGCQQAFFRGGRVNIARSIALWPLNEGDPLGNDCVSNFDSFGLFHTAPSAWMHSVTLEADFKDPWTALDLAFHLSVQVAQDLHEGLPFVHNLSGSPRGLGRRSALRNTCTRVVNFAPEVDLHIGDDDELYMVQLTVPHASLWKPDKPWSLLPKACSHDQHSLDDPHILMSKGDTNFAPIHQTLHLSVPWLSPKRFKPKFCQWLTCTMIRLGIGLYSFSLGICNPFLRPDVSSSQEADGRQQFCKTFFGFVCTVPRVIFLSHMTLTDSFVTLALMHFVLLWNTRACPRPNSEEILKVPLLGYRVLMTMKMTLTMMTMVSTMTILCHQRSIRI